jgi:carbon monoxide dehydrogenase subunit G
LIIAESFEIDVPIDRMFAELNDVDKIGYCIAGVKDVTVINADESRWKVEARAGFMARTFNLKGKITERRSPGYLAFTGAGQDVELSGNIQLSPVTAIRTKCETTVEVTVVGPFASIVDLMAKGPQQALIRETIDNVRKRLEVVATGQEAPALFEAAVAESAVQAWRPGVLARWLRFLPSRRARVGQPVAVGPVPADPGSAVIADADLMGRLRGVADRQEIHEVLMRYCRGVDRQDEALINSAFHPDGINDNGAPAPASQLAKKVAGLDPGQRMHFTGNVLIELDGDTGHAETYFIAFSPREQNGKTYTRTRAGRWLDRFERRDGVWKIAHRMVIDEWARLDEIVAAPSVSGYRGISGSDDPVFHLRELLKSGQ